MEKGLQRFVDKVVIITGAASGLGLATTQRIAEEGGTVVMVDLAQEALDNAVSEVKTVVPNARLHTIVADVSKAEQVKAYVDETVREFGKINGFYNNAGIEGRQAPLVEYDLETFNKVIDVNLGGVFYGLKYVLEQMVKQGYGHIVNASSVGGLRGVDNQTAYVASKHAVAGMTKNAAVDYGRYDVTVNAIAPGAIKTPMVAEAFRQVDPENPAKAEAEFAANNPTRHLGAPEDVAALVAFLLSEDCRYINGQVIAIDGGQSHAY